MKLSNYSGLIKLAVSENLRAPTIFTEGTDEMNPTPPNSGKGQEGIFPGDVTQVTPPGQPGSTEDPNAVFAELPPEDGSGETPPAEGQAPYGQESIDVAIADAIRNLSQATMQGSPDSGNVLRDIVFSTRGMQPPPPPPPPEPAPMPISAEEMMAMSQGAPGSLMGSGAQPGLPGMEPNLGAANPDLPAEGVGEAGKDNGGEKKPESKEKKPDSSKEKKPESKEKKSEGREIKVSVK